MSAEGLEGGVRRAGMPAAGLASVWGLVIGRGCVQGGARGSEWWEGGWVTEGWCGVKG